MSAGAPINIPAILDLAKPYADLAAFRAAAAQPVTIGTGSGAGSYSTFGAPGSQPFAANAVIGAYQPVGPRPTGLGPLLGQQAQTAGFGGTGSAPQLAQLSAAVQQLTAAANAMAGAAGNAGGAGALGAGGDGGGGGGGNNFFTRGFRRLLSGYFVGREAVGIAEDYYQFQTRQQLADRIGDNNQVRAIDREQQFRSRIFGIPVIGWGAEIADIATGAGRRLEFRKQDYEEYYKDRQADLQRQGRADASDAQTASINRNTSVFSIQGEYGRGVQRTTNRARDEYGRLEAEGRSRRRELDYLDSDTSPESRREFQRKSDDFDQFKSSGQRHLDAIRAQATAEAADATRKILIESGSLRRQTGVESLLAQGKIGQAGELAFENSLTDKYQSALERGGGALAFTQNENNKLARVARGNDIKFDVSQIQRRIESIGYELNRDPYQAGLSRIESDFEPRIRNARSVAESRGLERERTLEQSRFKQQFDDSTRRISRRYDDDISRLGIQNDRSIDPFARETRARAFDILADVRNQSEDITKSGRGSAELFGKIRAEASLKFDRERNHLLEGIVGANIDPTLTPTSGLGTFNLGSAINDLTEGKKRIDAEQAGGIDSGRALTADQIGKAVADSLGGILKSLGISDILTAIQKLQGQ